MHIEKQGVVFNAESQPPESNVAFFDSLCRLRSGSWLCGFTVGRAKHHPESTIRFCRSRDGGENWQPIPFAFKTRLDSIPGSLAGAEVVELERGKLLLMTTWFNRSDPARPLFNPETEGILPSRQLAATSDDEGDSWSDWQIIPTPGLTGTAGTGPLVRWDNGVVGFPFESFKEFDDPSPTVHGSWLILSEDQGKTWEKTFLVAQDPRHRVYYWDQRLCVGREPGELICLFWTHDRDSKRDLGVHFLRTNVNEGRRASQQPRELPIPGQIAAPLLLPDGRILAFVVDRDQPGTMKLWSSKDDGHTWPAADALIVHTHTEQAKLSQSLTDVDYAKYWEDMGKWTFGHPAIRQLDRDRVMLTYYAGRPGCLGVHWARVNLAAIT